MNEKKKYCKHCGELIDDDCVVCPKCGKQVEQLTSNNRCLFWRNILDCWNYNEIKLEIT